MNGPAQSRAALAIALLVACCGGPEPAPAPAAPPQQPAPVEHDFGVIPHGQVRQHDFVIDTRGYPSAMVPLRIQLDCACGRGQIILRAPDGSERLVDGSPWAHNAQRTDEQLVARIFVETITKDPIDLPPTVSKGHVVLQPADDGTGTRRVFAPFLLRFGIDCPVLVRPFAAIDFGKIALSAQKHVDLTLGGDEHHAAPVFGAVSSSHPAIAGELTPAADGARLRVCCRPGELGSHRGYVSVATNLPDDYKVNIGVTWKVVPDLEAYPVDKLSFFAPLDREQTAAEAGAQYLQVVNHGAGSPEFVVREVVGDDGRDAAANFAIRFEPIDGQPRHHRMFVRYRGGLAGPFRGRIVLSPSDGEMRLPIALVLLSRK
jgi:hypothetical protein